MWPMEFSASSECDRADAILISHHYQNPLWAVQMHGRGWFRRNTVGAIGEQKGRPWPKAEIRSSSETSGFPSSPHSVSRGAT